jgi:hypothetical protein
MLVNKRTSHGCNPDHKKQQNEPSPPEALNGRHARRAALCSLASRRHIAPQADSEWFLPRLHKRRLILITYFGVNPLFIPTGQLQCALKRSAHQPVAITDRKRKQQNDPWPQTRSMAGTRDA